MYGYICPCCGDHLDPGEKCECINDKTASKEIMDKLIETENDGQMILKEAIA